jgi:nucleotide-binding universal stress UspA family protein/cytidylate kinase
MSVITISQSCFSKGQEIAEKVAAELGYRSISRRVLLKASEEFNVPELLLERALHDAPSSLDRFTHGKERYVAFIRQAFLEQISEDNVVYRGLAGHFFVQGIKHVLAVRIFTDLEERVKREMEREGLPREKALKVIENDDKERHNWSTALYGIDSTDSRLYDLALYLLKIGVDDAVRIICNTVQKPQFQTTPASQRALNNLLMAARAKSAIVRKWPTANVAVGHGNVLVHVDRNLPSTSGVTDEITRLVEPVPGVKKVRVIFYPRKREVRSKKGMSVVLLDKKRTSHLPRASRILVPMANPKTQEALFFLARSLLREGGGEIVALSVVTVPEQKDFHLKLTQAQRRIEILDHASEISRPTSVELRPVVRVSRSLSNGISDAAKEEGCNLIVLGYPGENGTRPRAAIEELLHEAETDLILLRLKSKFPPTRIAVSLGSTLNLSLMVRLAGTLADEFGGEITFLNVLPVSYTTKERVHTDEILVEAIRQHATHAVYRTELFTSDVPLDLLIEKSAEFDLLIVGTTKVGLFEKPVVGSFAAQLAEKAACSVAVVRAISSK